MKKTARTILSTIILASLFLSALASAQEPTSSRVMVHAGKLLDVRSGKILTGQAIVIEAGKIVSVSPFSQAKRASGDRLIDLSAATVLPGLTDAHTHLTGNPQDAGPQALGISLPRATLTGARNARITLEAGFTTVRNVGAEGYSDVALRDAIDAGDVPGPRMGFYRPATIVKDAQRHGLKIFPIDVMKSEWECTVVGAVVGRESSVVRAVVGRRSLAVGQKLCPEDVPEDAATPAAERRENVANGVSRGSAAEENRAPEERKMSASTNGGRDAHRTAGGTPALRIGLHYVRGLREDAARAIVRQRNLAPFTSIHDLIQRVPELRKDELNTLAEIGALNSIGRAPQRNRKEFQNTDSRLQIAAPHQSEISNLKSSISLHRRDALWQIERAVRHSGSLLDELPEPDARSPLRPMGPEKTRLAYLQERKEMVYENLRDLNFEHQAGKLPDQDFQSLKASLEDEAAGILAEMARLEQAATRPHPGRKETRV